MRIVADLHIHSRYSRAWSRDMEVEVLSRWAKLKGVDVLGTGDFTHPLYFAELKAKLEPADGGLLGLKGGLAGIRFIPTAEVTNIYHQNGKLHKIHTLIVAPTLEAVEKINRSLARRGRVRLAPGYDGLYGKISLFSQEEKALPEDSLAEGLS